MFVAFLFLFMHPRQSKSRWRREITLEENEAYGWRLI
jgi:hypothetical protein